MNKKLSAYAAVLKPREVARRAGILAGTFRDHQFERSSPLPPLPPDLARTIYNHEVTMPPFHYLEGPGTQTIPGLFFLISLSKALTVGTVFEIGTYTGLTTWALARNLPDAEVHTLDLPVGERPAMDLEVTDEANRLEPVHEHVYEVEPHEGHVTQHWGDSADFVFSPWTGRCDLVYVDGAHSEPYVRSDTAHALEMLSERGAVVWDDYWRQVDGVPRVLHGLGGVELFRVPGTRLVVHMAPGAAAALR